MEQPNYIIDNEADLQPTMLSAFKEEYNISEITRKLNDQDELTEKEELSWKLAFEMALTDDYSLTKRQLLTTHTWWLKRLEYHSGIDDEKYNMILSDFMGDLDQDIYLFLDDVFENFSVEELHSITLPELD